MLFVYNEGAGSFPIFSKWNFFIFLLQKCLHLKISNLACFIVLTEKRKAFFKFEENWFNVLEVMNVSLQLVLLLIHTDTYRSFYVYRKIRTFSICSFVVPCPGTDQITGHAKIRIPLFFFSSLLL